jgi:Cu2+-exporting ATPase
MFEKYAPRIKGDLPIRKTTLRIENIQCAACVWLNEQHWRKLPGVSLVEINYMSQRATIHFDDRYTKLSELLIAPQQLGYRAWPFELSHNSLMAKKKNENCYFEWS